MIDSARPVREFLTHQELIPTRSNTGRISDEERRTLSENPVSHSFRITFANGEQIAVEVYGSGREPSSFWRVMAHIQRLSAHQQGWDSFKGKPLDGRAVSRAFHLFPIILQDDGPAPIVIPTAQGGLQFEWHCRGIDLEINIPPEGAVSLLIVDQNTGEEIDQEGFDNQVVKDTLIKMRD